MESEQQQQPEIGSAADPISTPVPAETTDLDALLAQYDASVKPEPDPAINAGNSANDAPGPAESIDDIVKALNADTEKAQRLEGELNALKSEYQRQELYRAEEKAFGEFAEELQSKLPDHCPPDYARNALLSAAAVNRDLAVAWDNRNLTPAQRANAARELQSAIQLYQQIQRQPDSDPRKAQALNWIVQQGQRLERIVQGPALLRRTLLDIEDRARKHIVYDADATADRALVAASVRGASAKALPERPPNYGTMSNNEFRKEVIDKFGFDPVT